jgi:hypothetical protein
VRAISTYRVVIGAGRGRTRRAWLQRRPGATGTPGVSRTRLVLMVGQPADGDPRPVRRPEASELRISDEDRHKVAEVLRQAAGEGRIDLEELDERLEATYRAKTYGELVPITVDLPIAGSEGQCRRWSDRCLATRRRGR